MPFHFALLPNLVIILQIHFQPSYNHFHLSSLHSLYRLVSFLSQHFDNDYICCSDLSERDAKAYFHGIMEGLNTNQRGKWVSA
jgi:hypothetical protein